MQAPFGPKAINRRRIPDSPEAFQRRAPRRRAAALGFAATVLGGGAAQATTAQQLCPGAGNPCVVNQEVAIAPNSVIDLGTRGLRLSGSGQLRILSGKLTLLCGALTVDASAAIRSSGQRRDVAAAAIDIHAASITLAGRIDSRGTPPGSVTLAAAGALVVSGEILGRAESGDASGATVNLSADSVTLSGSIDLGGGREDVGGDLTVTAASSLTVGGSADLDMSGGEGGSIDLTSAGSLRVDAGATLDAEGLTIAEDGGSVSIDAGGPLTMHGDISATARQGDEENGAGDGGSVTIGSDGDIDLLNGGAEIDASGGAPDGIGGDIEIESSFGSLSSAAHLVASVTGGDGFGGTIDLTSATRLQFRGSADARGGASGGGDIDLDCDGDLSLERGALLDASGVRSGAGGSVGLTSDTVLTVAGTVHADGGNSDGSQGGTVAVRSCEIFVAQSGSISVLKPSGRNALTSRSRCEIAGALRAQSGSGANELRYRAAGEEPVILAGAVIQPSAQLIKDETLVPCGEVPPTATPTDTPLATASPTPTATTIALCSGDCDGNRRVDIAELVRAVNIALGRAALASCAAADRDGNGSVGINELIAAVGAALSGCPA